MEIIRVEDWGIISEKRITGLKEIYENSFPFDERRNFESYKNLNPEIFSFFLLIDKGILSGFFTFWSFPDFNYIEHLAIKSTFRNRGIGSKLVDFISLGSRKIIVLEVERPGCDSADKRIRFYLKHSFNFCDFDYLQPSYDKDKKPVQMNIMAYPNSINIQRFQGIKNNLYRVVYNSV